MRGRRLPPDRIPQRETEAIPFNYDLIAGVENHAVGVTGDAAAQEVDVHVARNPVRLEFKMMLLDLLQRERGVLFAGPDFLGPYRIPVPLHRNRARDVLEFGIERQFRSDRAISQLRPRKQARIPPGRHRIREFVSRGESYAPGDPIRTDEVNRGDLRFLGPASRETRNRQRLSMGAQMHAVALGKPRRRRGNRIAGWSVSVRASRNQAAGGVTGMIEARQEAPAAPQSINLAIIQDDSG